MYILDGKRLPLDKAFTTSDGRQFPRNWLRLSSLEERTALGITEEPDVVAPVYDQRFYWSSELPKDLDQLKETWTAQVKDTAGKLLAPTDWYIVRQAENSTSIPAEVLTRRGEIRTFSNEKEAAIAAATTVEEFVTYVTSSDFNRWDDVVEEPVTEEGTVTTTEETIDFSNSTSSSTVS